MHRSHLLAAALLLASTAAHAQPDPAGMARSALANQLGVLEYCQVQGHTGADAVEAQRAVMARMPGSGVSTSDAENMGKDGTLVSSNGQQFPLASMAQTQNVSVATMCKQMADSALRMNDAYTQNGASAGGIPGLPSMSNMPGVPGFPAQSGLPSLAGPPVVTGAPKP